MSTSNKYKPGEFGYWWTVTKGNEDIEGVDYEGMIVASRQKLTSLRGSPRSVTGDFFCIENKLKSLEYCPENVDGDFCCSYNQLTSIKHCPAQVNGRFWCNNNKITNLEHSPKKVGGDFCCNCNKLTSLEHCPESVGGSFHCHLNQLICLVSGPVSVAGSFECERNSISDPLSEVINSGIIAEDYQISEDLRMTFEEIEIEKLRRANVKRQLGPFAITVTGGKI